MSILEIISYTLIFYIISFSSLDTMLFLRRDPLEFDTTWTNIFFGGGGGGGADEGEIRSNWVSWFRKIEHLQNVF